MARGASKKTDSVISGILYTDDPTTTGTRIDSPAWVSWLSSGVGAFYFEGLTVRLEKRQRGGLYWFAYRRVAGKLYSVYIGAPEAVTWAALQAAVQKIDSKATGKT